MASTTAVASSIAASAIAANIASQKVSSSKSELSSAYHCGTAALKLQVSKATSHVAAAAARGSAGSARATIAVTPPAQSPKKKSLYELETFTGWLLKSEQEGVIDGELTIVLSSIAVACKQIASLVQRAGISNLTGVQGAVNVQGEDQKKLDVISNEVNLSYISVSHNLGFYQLILAQYELLWSQCSHVH
jgi:fructose-1,6-bisphosphatase I